MGGRDGRGTARERAFCVDARESRPRRAKPGTEPAALGPPLLQPGRSTVRVGGQAALASLLFSRTNP